MHTKTIQNLPTTDDVMVIHEFGYNPVASPLRGTENRHAVTAFYRDGTLNALFTTRPGAGHQRIDGDLDAALAALIEEFEALNF